jgi:hypothetical protein
MSNEASRQLEEFTRRQHEKGLTASANEAMGAAAELVAQRIATKLAEQNDIIYKIGQQQGRTSAVAYLSLAVAALAAIGQLFGPITQWAIFKAFFG